MSATVCSKCGNPLEAGAKFCGKCGQSTAPSPTSAASVTPPPPPPASVPAAPKPAAPGPSKGGLPLVPLGILGGGLVVVLAAVFVLRKPAAPPDQGGMAPPAAPATQGAMVPPASGAPSTGIADVATVTPYPPAQPATGGSPFPQSQPAQQGQPMQGKPALSSQPPGGPTGYGGTAPGSVAGAPGAPPKPGFVAPGPAPTPPIYRTYETRKYMVFNVTPERAHLHVDGKHIGTCDEWDESRDRKKYEFEKSGVHYVKISHEKYETRWIKVIVDDKVEKRVAHVDLSLKKIKKNG